MPLLFSVMVILMVLYYCIEGFGYAGYNVSASYPFIGAALAKFLMGTGMSSATLLTIHNSLWWLNYVILLGALVYAPRSEHLHPLASFPNMVLKSLSPKAALKPLNLEEGELFGAARLQDFTWKQLLDLYACTWCGRCQDACPAHLSGKPLSPRELILNLKEHLLDEGLRVLEARSEVSLANPGKAMIGDVITEDEIWACTTCRACQEVCPVYNEHIDKIVDMRRYLVQVEAKFPEEMIPVFRNVEVYGDTFGMGQSSRLEWAHGLGVEEASEKVQYDALLWLGCEDTFNDRRMQVSRELVKILQKVGIKFAVLGRNEACCGDLARRMGNEYLFQEMVSKNIEALNKFNFKYILTMCPHCYNTLKNEYKHFGGEYEVLHYTELFGRLFEEKKIEFVYPVGAKVIYHDPCYLGRGSEIYEPPRNILKGIKGLDLLEFGRYQKNSFCCGAGGGHKWMHEAAGTRVSDIRVEEAMEEAPDTICTTCPYCLEMFEDSVRTLGLEDKIKTLDLIEVMSHAIK
ncbi:putative iron-sulfur-binding oxidoreductase FadF [subsurface metagenome]